jgi:hypothetical protein
LLGFNSFCGAIFGLERICNIPDIAQKPGTAPQMQEQSAFGADRNKLSTTLPTEFVDTFFRSGRPKKMRFMH